MLRKQVKIGKSWVLRHIQLFTTSVMGRSPAVTKDAREQNFVTIIFAFFPTGCKYGLEKLTGTEFKISDFCG